MLGFINVYKPSLMTSNAVLAKILKNIKLAETLNEKFTLKEIGQVLEVSESRVCQLHSRAIRNLREIMKKNNYIY